MADTIKRDEVIEKLQGAIDTEHAIVICCGHLTSLIKNGRIRDKFRSISAAAKANQELLSERLVTIGVKDFVLGWKCTYCKMSPEAFSLKGAIELGLEVTATTIRFYKDLLRLSDNIEDKKLFKRLLKAKTEQRGFLKSERRFPHRDEDRQNLATTYCIPEVISKLWK